MASGSAAGGTRLGEIDPCLSDVEVALHPQVNTMLVVTWNQSCARDEAWLEFSFEGSSEQRSRGRALGAGRARDVVLGVPADTRVSLRIASRQRDAHFRTGLYRARTGSLPASLPRPQVSMYDRVRASPERWLFGSVEDSIGGGGGNYYTSTFWLYIMDRSGKIVWYHAEPASNAASSFQRLARDGPYIVFEKRCYACGVYAESIVKMSLDAEYFEEIPVEGLSDSIDVTAEGTLLYDAFSELRELGRDGSVRTIWSCREHYGQDFDCYTNTINYSEGRDSVLMAYPEPGIVVEIARVSGELLAEFGNGPESWAFAPPNTTPPDAWSFGFPHFPSFTESGTLLLSSHMPGFEDTLRPVAYQHAFIEFELDREQRRLVERWRYSDGPEWPRWKGMALRLANGNTLVNYGTGGVIRELAPDKTSVWYAKFDVVEGDDFYNKMLGHNVLVDDLYALNGRPGE